MNRSPFTDSSTLEKTHIYFQMNPSIPPQATFFYKGKWNQNLDRQLLSFVMQTKCYSEWKGVVIPDSVILEASAMVNDEEGRPISAAEVKLRMKVFKARYNTFKELTDMPGVHWDVHRNVLVAKEEVWKQIFKRNPFAAAYYHRDEPQYYLLATIFGLTNENRNEETELIIVSDTTELIVVSDTLEMANCAPNLPNPSPSDPDEVNSPVLVGATKVRRKLFIEDSSTANRMSSNMGPVSYLAPFSEGSLKYEIQNQPPVRAIPLKNNIPKSSNAGSSSGSCSPFATSRKTVP